ncbi:MAG: radical SAM protein [Bryobacterales bacterium]|nr:radical SAM protein [Bryobacterales bacterium]
MSFKTALVFSNDDGFSLGVEFLKASVRQKLSAGTVDHRVWLHSTPGDLSSDYLGQYNTFLANAFQFRPDLVAFSVYVWNYDDCVRMSAMIHRFLPGTRILWGGAQTNSTRMAGELMERWPWLDFVIRGEAEDSYPALLEQLAADGDVAAVDGLTWRQETGVVHNKPAPQVSLPSIPLVFHRANIDLEKYTQLRRPPTLAYETGRGCRQKCNFCLYGVPALRAFPMDRVEQELRYILDSGIPSVRICDAHFGISRRRAMELFEIIARHNRNSIVDIYPDSKHVDREYIEAMNRAGCRVVSLGLQSSDADTLKTAERKFDESVFRSAARLLRKHHNYKLSADLILGMPEDNYEKVRESIRFAYRNGVERLHFAPLMAFPGTNLYERAEQFGLEHFDFAPPLAIQSRGYPVSDYRRSMVLAHTIERIQNEAPVVLRCLLASGQDPVRFAEQLIAGGLLTPEPLYRNPEFEKFLEQNGSAELTVLLQAALTWERARARQSRARPMLQMNLNNPAALIAAVNHAALVKVQYPVQRVLHDWETSLELGERSECTYLFPLGGTRAYLLDGPLLQAWQCVAPGMPLSVWRQWLHRVGTRNGWDGAALDEGLQVVCLSGAIEWASAEARVEAPPADSPAIPLSATAAPRKNRTPMFVPVEALLQAAARPATDGGRSAVVEKAMLAGGTHGS